MEQVWGKCRPSRVTAVAPLFRRQCWAEILSVSRFWFDVERMVLYSSGKNLFMIHSKTKAVSQNCIPKGKMPSDALKELAFLSQYKLPSNNTAKYQEASLLPNPSDSSP